MSGVEALTDALVRASLEGAVAVGIVWLLCAALPRLPASLRCFLWWAACLRFLVALPGWGVATLPLLPAQWSAAPAVVAELADDSAPSIGSTATAVGPSALARRPPDDPRREPATARPGGPADRVATVRPWLAALWLAGVAAGTLGFGRAVLRLRRLIEGARPVSDRRLTSTLAHLCRRLALRPPTLLASPAIASPLVVGPARPRVLLPASGLAGMAEAETEMVLCHELAHLRRGDLWLGWLPALARTIFFFHPLAALAAREYALAREAACDAEVLRLLGSAPRDYGRLLLRWGTAPRESGLAAAAAAPSRHHLKRRLLMLEDHSRSPRRRALLWTAPLVVAVLTLLPLQLVASEGEATILDPALLAALPTFAASDDEKPAPPPAPAARPRPAGLSTPAAPPAPLPMPRASLAVTAAPAAPAAPPGVPTAPAVAPQPATPAVPAVGGITATPAPAPAPAPGRPVATGAPTPAPAPTPPPPAAAPAVPRGAAPAASSSYELQVSTSPVAAPRGAGAGAGPTPGAARTTVHSAGSSDRGAWVYLEGDARTSMSGDSGDAEAAKRARRGDETLLYVRQGDSAWVVRDAALLAEAKSILAPVLELGRQQGELGREQGALGRRQGDLGREQGDLGRQQGALGAELGRLVAEQADLSTRARATGEEERAALAARRSELRARVAEIEERMHALGEQQRQLGERQRPLGDEQRELGERQRELGERQRQASRRAEEELMALVARARTAGKAQPVR